MSGLSRQELNDFSEYLKDLGLDKYDIENINQSKLEALYSDYAREHYENSSEEEKEDIYPYEEEEGDESYDEDY